MSREIKFRAWHNTFGMIEIDEIDFNAKTFHSDSLYDDLNTIILMQYTGLHDKNGKEIYEGDILNTSISEQYGTCILYYVTWDWRDGGFMLYNSEWDSDEFLQNVNGEFAKDRWCEVIGNIYENPELLQEENK